MRKAALYSYNGDKPVKLVEFHVDDNDVASVYVNAAATGVETLAVQRLEKAGHGSHWSDIERRMVPFTEGNAFIDGIREHLSRTSRFGWFEQEDLPDGEFPSILP